MKVKEDKLMKLKYFIIILAIVLILTACEKENIPTDAIRLHVIANSDDDYDQQVKLKVKDAIIKDCSKLLVQSKSADESFCIVKNSSTIFSQTANQTLKDNGYAYKARIETGKFMFPDKMYEQAAFPAGEYRALKIVLGEGEGKNWWCVLYPPLCVVFKAQENNADTIIDESEEIVFESFILEKIFKSKTPQPDDEALSRLQKLFKKANWS